MEKKKKKINYAFYETCVFILHIDPGFLPLQIGNFIVHNGSQKYVHLCELELPLNNNKNVKVVCENII